MNAQRIKGPPEKSFRRLLFVFLPPLVHGCPGTSQHRSRMPISHRRVVCRQPRDYLPSGNLAPSSQSLTGKSSTPWGIWGHFPLMWTLDNPGCLRYLNNTGRKRNWRNPNPRHGPKSHPGEVITQQFSQCLSQLDRIFQWPKFQTWSATIPRESDKWKRVNNCWVEVTSTHRCRFSWLVPCHSDRQ